MTADDRLAVHARAWGVTILEVRTTETSKIAFGTRGDERVVLKVIRSEGSEEWRCGEILEAFGGGGVIRVLARAGGAVLMPRLVPGYELSELSLHGRDDEAARRSSPPQHFVR
jgi:streptomycin 6-kinase